MEIKLEFNDKESKILNSMVEILEKEDPKHLIESLLKEKWIQIKQPKKIDLLSLTEFGAKKIFEIYTKRR